MNDQIITQADLASLARKLDEVADVLTEKEKNLLLAVFKIAGATITARVQGGPATGERESGSISAPAVRSSVLSNGFKDAFKSVGQADFNIRTGLDEVAGGVGIGVIW